LEGAVPPAPILNIPRKAAKLAEFPQRRASVSLAFCTKAENDRDGRSTLKEHRVTFMRIDSRPQPSTLRPSKPKLRMLPIADTQNN
jgi:hypothetical protein